MYWYSQALVTAFQACSRHFFSKTVRSWHNMTQTVNILITCCIFCVRYWVLSTYVPTYILYDLCILYCTISTYCTYRTICTYCTYSAVPYQHRYAMCYIMTLLIMSKNTLTLCVFRWIACGRLMVRC